MIARNAPACPFQIISTTQKQPATPTARNMISISCCLSHPAFAFFIILLIHNYLNLISRYGIQKTTGFDWQIQHQNRIPTQDSSHFPERKTQKATRLLCLAAVWRCVLLYINIQMLGVAHNRQPQAFFRRIARVNQRLDFFVKR
jgi:hypothetical protein